MRFITSFGCLTLLCVGHLTTAEEPDPRMDAVEIRKLIDQLVSPNPAPTINEPRFKLAKGFDKEKQKQIYAARTKLRKIGPAAFPYLIERWDDKRYSITMSVGINGFCFNASVGDVCRDIIFDQLQPYGIWPKTDSDPRGNPKRPGYPSKFLSKAKDAAAWCEENKDKTLFEIQLLIIDWVIEQEAEQPTSFTEDERSHVQKIRDELIKVGKPMKAGNYWQNDTEA